MTILSDKTKYIFVTGGVVSGIGKGITVASLGTLFKARGYNVALMKFDPYLNFDAGTMNPFQHGEVFVTDDGAETDLDLGHYERFADVSLNKLSNATTGKIYAEVFEKERRGEYLGKTIQMIPHVTDEIINWIKNLAIKTKADIVIIEIGGTIGDIEAEVYLEAIRQFKRRVGTNNTAYVHVSKIDYVYPSQEPKTKPTQATVNILRSRGITPNLIVVRCKKSFSKDLKEKIALFADVDEDCVIPAPNANSLYQIPLIFEKFGIAKKLEQVLELKPKKANLKLWQKISGNIKKSTKKIKVAMVGKYTEHPDAYLSVVESLLHAGINNLCNVEIIHIDSEKSNGMEKLLRSIDGIVVPGGFGIRGIEGKIKAIKFARENKIPFLGLCLGLQCAVIEFGRNKCSLKNANSTEFDPKTKHPIIDILPEQKTITDKGGTMRLGSFPAKLQKGSLISKLYKNIQISERHRHRYEVNPDYHSLLKKNGMVLSGMSPNGKLVEFIELPTDIHPYFVATQAHPEFKSRPTRPAPLFDGLIKAIKDTR